MSTPEAQRNASKAYRKRLKEAGSKQIGFVLSPDALAALDKLAVNGVSKAQAVNAALISAAKVEEERSAAYYAIYGNTLTAEHVPIHRLDVDAEHRLAGPEKPSEQDFRAIRADVRAKFPKTLAKLHEAEKAERSDPLASVQVGPAPFKPRLKGKK